MQNVIRSRPFSLALAIGLMAAVGLSAPASATVWTGPNGLTGDYGMYEPGGRCGYSAEDVNGEADLRWIKAFAPEARARNVTLGRDQQKVSWQFKIQRSNNGGPWRTVATSPVQTRTAYDDTYAAFTPMKAYFNGNGFDQDVRAQVVIKWIRNGSTEGWVKGIIEYYSVKWTVGDPNFVFTGPCSGTAD